VPLSSVAWPSRGTNMAKGRACLVCGDQYLSREVGRMLAEGLSQSEISRQLGIGKMSLSRHVRAHLLPVTKAIAAAVERDNPAREQRQALIAAAEAGDLQPENYLTLGAIVGDLRRAAERIERVSQTAEEAGQATAVAALTGQAIRTVETRARLGSVGGFAPQKGRGDGETATPFSITIHLAGRTEKLELTPIIDHVPTDAAPREEVARGSAASHDREIDQLARAFCQPVPLLEIEDDEADENE
jgi:hypothetical protein